jgi:ubiquinone/menaquinone biosynthesis C-methylase UbiE
VNNQIIDHLKYYKNLNREVTVDLKDLRLNQIYTQRFNFYFLMGLTPSDFNNKSILELGSGTGYNAYYLIKKCNVKKITFVEKNYNSLKKLKKNLANFKNVKIKNENINSYKDKKKYDFVICENTIDNFLNPSVLLKKMMKWCKAGGGGGRIIINFGDNYGTFSTKLRYLYALMLIQQKNVSDFQSRLELLTKVFKKDLSFLSKNVRNVNKWVLDNILNENWVKKTNFFGLMEIKKLIKKNFLIYSFYPQFNFNNNFFYKNANLHQRNEIIINSHISNKLNLLCTQLRFDKKTNLDKLINSFNIQISKLSFDNEISFKVLDSILKILRKVYEKFNVLKPNNIANESIKEFIKLIMKFKKNEPLPLKTNNFYKFWSFYNQYCVLYKI